MDNPTTQMSQPQTQPKKPTAAEIALQKQKDDFIKLLKQTNREGIDKVITGLEKLGFFVAPASTKHHLAEKGGLLEHSMNVFVQAMMIRKMEIQQVPALEEKLPVESIIIASLLHDVCKAEIYQEELKHRKLKTGKWEDYMGYNPDYHHCPLGHGEKSVIRLLRMKLDLTDDEILAIRWHMGPWDLSDSPEAKGNFNAACDKCPLLSILMAADGLATRISENTSLKAKQTEQKPSPMAETAEQTEAKESVHV